MNATALDPRRPAGPSLARLTAIELRKTADTRAGKWMLGLTALFAVGFIVIALAVADPSDLTLPALIQGSAIPVSLLPPIVAILALTAEWTQRTGLITFALVPRRGRVIVAKLGAVIALALGTVVLALLTSLIGSALAGVDSGSPELRALTGSTGEALGNLALFMALQVLMAAAFGLALMRSALAIVLYFILPTILTALAAAIPETASVLGAINPNETWFALASGFGGSVEWDQVALSAAAMIGAPLAIGLVRLSRAEIK